jgi:hypothetical protein
MPFVPSTSPDITVSMMRLARLMKEMVTRLDFNPGLTEGVLANLQLLSYCNNVDF